jgi:integrase
MIRTLFRPKRLKNGKPHITRSYRGRYRLDGADKITDIPLHTTDKRVAQQRLEQIVQEKQLESVGILPSQAIRKASQTPLEKHLCDYLADLQAVGRGGQYIYELKNRIRRLMHECLWAQIKDISSDSFLAWRTKQTLAPKTVNEYLISISSLLNWMEKHERIERNPLRHIQKVQSNGKQTRPRRAFTREEFRRLLAVSQARRPVYLTAVFTGLRRSELAALEWDDVHLNATQPFLNVRASTTKNHKQAVIGLHEDVVTELRKLQVKRHSSANGLVFAALMPNMETFKADLKEAKIEFINAKNQRADFHSLRHTLATNLALAGTAPRVAMEIMRHCDMRLTSKTYTDAGLLPITDAVAKLPSFTDLANDSQIDSQNSIRTSQTLSMPVEKITNRDGLEITNNKGLMSLLSTSVTTSQERKEWCAIQGCNHGKTARFILTSWPNRGGKDRTNA